MKNANQTEKQRRRDDLQKRQNAHGGKRDFGIRIRHTELTAHKVRRDAADDGGKQDGIKKLADEQHFDAEHGARDRRAENGGQSGGRSANHQLFTVFFGKTKRHGQLRHEPRADLDGRPFGADDAAARDRDERRQDLDRHDGERDSGRAVVNGGNDLVRAVAFGGRRKTSDCETGKEQSDGNQRDAPIGQRQHQIGPFFQQPQEQPDQRARRRPRRRGQNQPLADVFKQQSVIFQFLPVHRPLRFRFNGKIPLPRVENNIF